MSSASRVLVIASSSRSSNIFNIFLIFDHADLIGPKFFRSGVNVIKSLFPFYEYFLRVYVFYLTEGDLVICVPFTKIQRKCP